MYSPDPVPSLLKSMVSCRNVGALGGSTMPE